MYSFCKYNDETECSFSEIIIKENKEYIYIYFERPTEKGFDSVKFELPTYNIVYKEGEYSKEEIEKYKTVVENGAPYFFKWAKEGGIRIA